MASIDLKFGLPPITGLPARLVFGEESSGPPIPPVAIQGTGTLSGLRGRMRARVGVRLRSSGALAGLRGRMDAFYDVNVDRPTVGQARSVWQDAGMQQDAARTGWQDSATLPVGMHSGWEDAAPGHAAARTGWESTEQLQRAVRERFEDAVRLGVLPVRNGFQSDVPLQVPVRQRFEEARRITAGAGQSFQTAVQVSASLRQHYQEAERLGVSWSHGMGIAVSLTSSLRNWYQEAWPPRPGRSVILPPDPPDGDPCYLPELPVRLVFAAPAVGGLPVRLLFTCERHGPGPEPEEPQYVIPVLRIYMQVHTIKAELLPGNERVQLRDITISSDDEGFGWTMSASGPIELMDQLAPVAGLPAKIRVTIDGIEWIFAVDPPSRSRVFAQRGATVRGSSVTSLLGEPYMPSGTWSNSDTRTAQQLALEALQFTGVDLQWDIPDWTVPADVWSFQGTPLAAVKRIAEAVGAVVRSHQTLPQLQIVSRYKHLPWEWGAATPNVEMPSRIITSDELQPADYPPWEAAFVSGEHGTLGHVVRLGTAGVVLAPPVTDTLITHADAARERGRSILGAQGRGFWHPMTLPVLTGGTNPGLILPGYLLKVVEPSETWRGVVRSISVTAGMPTVRQSIRVERRPS